MHPSEILFSDSPSPPNLPVVEHYAGNRRFIDKALRLQTELNGAFDITLDLEDGASVGQEIAQAQAFGHIIASPHNTHQRIGVRIHEPAHPHFDNDLKHVLSHAQQAPAYWMIPKITSLTQTTEAIDRIAHIHAQLSIPIVPIHVLIETHGALHDVHSIAQLPQVQSLSFGLMDFVSAHHGTIPEAAMTSPLQFDHPMVAQAKIDISRACAAHGKIANHNVCTDYQNPESAYQDARRARDEFGYSRMWSIHPIQIAAILRAFAPEATAIDRAAHILLLAQNANWGPIAYEGKLHDRASYRHHWCTLQRAHRTHCKLPSSAHAWFTDRT